MRWPVVRGNADAGAVLGDRSVAAEGLPSGPGRPLSDPAQLRDQPRRRALELSRRRQRLAESLPGHWVAVSDDWTRVYAHGTSYLAVCDEARRSGAADPLVTRLV